ncbi:MAG TPA: hypothetical protein VFH61_18565, partial [Thermoleophilia bacterium]|nr:hypothetical protein [Thermoleophilia bacterium]
MRRWRRPTELAVIAAAATVLAACSVAGAQTEGGSAGPGVAQANVVVRPDGARSWHPDRPVVVSVTD